MPFSVLYCLDQICLSGAVCMNGYISIGEVKNETIDALYFLLITNFSSKLNSMKCILILLHKIH